MSDSKYDRSPHAGDFEQEAGLEVFYLSPLPLPTGMPAFSGERLHSELNEVYLDFAPGQRSLESWVRGNLGSIMFMVIFFCWQG